MKTVRKYYLDYDADTEMVVPSGATLLKVEAEETGAGGSFGFFVWAEVDTSNQDVTKEFRVIRDDEDFAAGEPASLTYLDSVIVEKGRYKVRGYHIYEK